MYNFCRSLVTFLFRIIYRVKIEGVENIPSDSFIISANHTHIFDPIVLMMLTKKQVFFMAKKEIFKYKFSNWFFTKMGVIPVDRENNDLSAVKKSLRVLRNNNILGIFPEGTRVKNIDYSNMKKGVAFIALKSNSKILPVHIESNYKIFSKVTVKVYNVIDTVEYVNIEELEAIDKITEDLFKSIYQ